MALAAPVLVVSERARPRLLAVPVYWHLLSLDAPTVAVVWAWSFALAAHVHASRAGLAILGIGTWLLYVADRLLDGLDAARRDHLRERHFFHARHRRALLLAAAAATLPLLWLIFTRMSAAARREDALLFSASMLYFAVVHLPALRDRRWFRREFAVGAVFACATAVPAWSRPAGLRPDLALLVLLFAGLCCLNCLAIEDWEQARSPFCVNLRSFPVAGTALALATAAALLALHMATRNPRAAAVSASIFGSALLLFALDRSRLSSLALRVAADAVLLTPLLLLLPWHP